jgi:hypothetical protein
VPGKIREVCPRNNSVGDGRHEAAGRQVGAEPPGQNSVHVETVSHPNLPAPKAMKSISPFRSATAVLVIAALALPTFTASAKNNGRRQPQLVSMFAKENRQDVATDALAAVPDAWTTIQYFTYDKRQDFTAIFTRMVAKLDDEIRALNAKRETMTNDTKNWDFAMKELNNARSDVQSKLTELSRATTPETWVEARDRLGVAWDRALTATSAVKASTTS